MQITYKSRNELEKENHLLKKELEEIQNRSVQELDLEKVETNVLLKMQLNINAILNNRIILIGEEKFGEVENV